MSSIMTESLNKGVPVGASIDIRHADLLSIVDNGAAVEKVLNKEFKKYLDFLYKFGEFSDIEYFFTLATEIDSNTLERKIIFSRSGYLSSLAFNLNLYDICRDHSKLGTFLYNGYLKDLMSTLGGPLYERIEILRKVHSADELRKNFPFLYNKYQSLLKETQQARSIALKLNSMGRAAKRDYIKRFDAEQRKVSPGFSLQSFLNEALSFNLDKFVNTSANSLQLLVDHSSEILRYLATHPINLDSLSVSDKNKLELYFAYRFLINAEMVPEDDKQNYLYYVSNFFAEHKDLLDSDLSIVVDSTKTVKADFVKQINPKGDVITPANVYERYRKLLVENPNLRAIDFSHLDFQGMNVREVEKFMTEYLKDLSAQWDFLAPEDKSYEEEIIKKIRKVGKGMTEEERARHQEKLLELLLQKKSLYDSSDPFFRVKGKGTFDGYIGFIYPNGRVVLDKFYDDSDQGKVADGHAVYAMGIQEFYELSRLSKTEIIRNKLCKRYIHKGNWAERVLHNEIQSQGTINPSVEVRKLIEQGEVLDTSGSIPSFPKK